MFQPVCGLLWLSLLLISESSFPLNFTLALAAPKKQDPNIRDKEGNTALHLICSSLKPFQQKVVQPEFRKELCETMLKSGINPDLKNAHGKTALECLQATGDPITRNLLQRVTLQRGMCSLFLAHICVPLKTLKFLSPVNKKKVLSLKWPVSD